MPLIKSSVCPSEKDNEIVEKDGKIKNEDDSEESEVEDSD